MGCKPSKTSPTTVVEQPTNKKSDSNRQVKKSKVQPLQEQPLDQKFTEEPDVLDHFPDPAKIPIVDYIPKTEAGYVKVEDTFWSKKRALIPDYSVMERIDNHVLKAEDSLRFSPDKLVAYLLKPCKTEVEKVRALIRWIGNNIAYDVVGRDDHSKADVSFEGVLKNKKAICDGYATVVQMFCKEAGIESEKISGQTKNGAHLEKDIRIIPESDHAWNRVKINNGWYFVDSTWCAGSVGDNKFEKNWNEWWFLPDPSAFVETHLPMARDNSLLSEQQMIQKPWQSSESWDRTVERKPAAYQFGIKPISHSERRFTTKENELIIKFQCKNELSHYINIYHKQGSTLRLLENTWHVIYPLNGVYHAHIRFPKAGVYHVKFVANIETGDKVILGSLAGPMYRVDFEGKPGRSFPTGAWGKLGIHANFAHAKFQMINPKSPIISTSTGNVTVTLKLPTAGIISNIFSFHDSSGSDDKGNLKGLVYGEKKGQLAKYNIQCPKVGEYMLTHFAKFKEGASLYPAVVVLIKCTNVNTKIYRHPKEGMQNTQLAGPDESFYKLGLTTKQQSSTIMFQGDTATLCIKKTEPASLLVKLKSSAQEGTDNLLKKEETNDQCLINIKRPNAPGYFWLELFAKKGSASGSYSYAGCFCIPNRIPHHGGS